MKKFILIDNSIMGFTGHYYEYAVRVLQAAQKAGYKSILATNRKFHGENVDKIEVHPVYKYGFWLGQTIPGYKGFRVIRGRISKWLLRWKYKLTFSSFWFYVSALKSKSGDAAHLSRAQKFKKLIISILLLCPSTLFKITKRLLTLIGKMLYGNHFSLGLAKRAFIKRTNAAISHVLSPLQRRFHNIRIQMFGEDTRRLFRRISLEEGDVVFIPTCSGVEMRGLLHYFRKDIHSKRATWHLLFRRNIYTGREPDYQKQEESLGYLKMQFDQFINSLTGQRIFFYTDTERLTAQHSRLSHVPFHTVPIPVSEEYSNRCYEVKEKSPYRIVYVGDARKEKGYHHLPGIVQDLWAEYVETGKVAFTIQSNFNIPEGEAEAAISRVQFGSFPGDKVTLIDEPLSTADYRALVFFSDIILLPYDRDNYYARSSGILVESLVAGIPVIVPAGTWMAEQLMEETFRYHASLNTTAKTLENTKIQWYRRVSSELCPVVTGKLSFGGEETRLLCHISPPQQLSHMILSFKVDESRDGEFVFINSEQLANRGYCLSKKAFIVRETTSGNPCSVMFPLEKDVSKIILDFKNAFTNSLLSISEVKISFLTASDQNRYPLGAVGLTYAYPEEIPDLIREMIANYTHYRQTAYSFSREWFNKHNAERLVAELERTMKCARNNMPTACSNAIADEIVQ